jgi:acetyl-CoA carboxylase alpha subunit
VAKSDLAHLHDRLGQVIELIQALQSENVNLRQEVQQLRQDLEELKRENNSKSQLVERFENNRHKIRSRVENVLRNVATLEEQTRG